VLVVAVEERSDGFNQEIVRVSLAKKSAVTNRKLALQSTFARNAKANRPISWVCYSAYLRSVIESIGKSRASQLFWVIKVMRETEWVSPQRIQREFGIE
jgi:hypothetical protein